jgi:homoserine kinase
MKARAQAFAPASVGNVGVGFDCLGHAIGGVGDRALVERIDAPRTEILAIEGADVPLPMAVHDNTAGRALESMRTHLKLDFGFRLTLKKGIPFASGLGGSAASASAAVIAANALLKAPLKFKDLYRFALDGEEAASNSRHGDNVAPQLLGGLVLIAPDERLIRLPLPPGLWATVVHPDYALETKTAREPLKVPFDLHPIVEQLGFLASFVSACYQGDVELMRDTLRDGLIEPRRAALIPGFAEVKQAALDTGAIGSSISGAGPSVFAWYSGERAARAGGEAMVQAFAHTGLRADAFVTELPAAGAHLEWAE